MIDSGTRIKSVGHEWRLWDKNMYSCPTVSIFVLKSIIECSFQFISTQLQSKWHTKSLTFAPLTRNGEFTSYLKRIRLLIVYCKAYFKLILDTIFTPENVVLYFYYKLLKLQFLTSQWAVSVYVFQGFPFISEIPEDPDELRMDTYMA